MDKRGPSRIRSFILFGGFVFLLTLLFNPLFSYRGPDPDHFFVRTDEIQGRLPFSIFAGVIFGLLYAFLRNKNRDA